jgi:hypothetical protein
MDRVFNSFLSRGRARARAKYCSSSNDLAWQAVGIFLMLRLTCSLLAQAPTVPNDHISPGTETNVTLPAQSTITNDEPAILLAEPEVPKTLAIFRFHPGAVTQAEASLRSAFAQTRDAFLAALERAARRRILDETTVAHPSFRTFVSWFQNEHPAFPLTGQLARLWALAQSDEAIQNEWTSKVRLSMTSYIGGEGPIDRIETGQRQVLMISLTRTNAVLNVEMAERWGSPVAITNIHTLGVIRKDFLSAFSTEQKDLGRFLSGFLKENCFFDEVLTTQLTKKKAPEAAITNFDAPRQDIVQSGPTANVISNQAEPQKPSTQPEWTSVAFDKLELVRAWGESLLVQLTPAWSRLKNAGWEVHVLLASLGVFLLIFLWWLHRRTRSRLAPVAPMVGAEPSYTVILNRDRNETIFLPVRATRNPGIVPVEALEPVTPLEPLAITDHKAWQERVLAAEKRAEELLAMVRAGLAPHLARELMNNLVRELISQRAGLLYTHQIAERELSSMEARFEKVIGQLQDRLAAYEKRNAELERELAAKREENLELIKASMVMTQNKLEGGQATKNVALN